MAKKKKEKPQVVQEYPLSRYLWIGAGLGIYFGYVFRPQSEMDYFFMLRLAGIVTIAMMLFKFIPRSRPPFSQLVPFAIKSYITYAVILIALETRHLAFAYGGRIAVIVLMTITGMLGGLWYAKRGSLMET